jgi:hypothetical protein
VLHGSETAALDSRSSILVLGGKPAIPRVGRLDDVVVDTDNLR